MPPPPEPTADTAPADAVRMTLAWLAAVVPDCRAVVSRGVLRRTRGTLHLDVRFQSSTWSRRGTGTWVTLYPVVRDSAFARWRREHPDRTWRSGDVVHSSGALRGGVQLYGDEPGYRCVAELPGLLEGQVLRRLDMYESPARLARELDVAWSSTFPCMEWAVSRGDTAAARVLLERYLEAHPAARETIEAGRAAGMPAPGTPIRDELRERWAPALETLGIVAPGEPLPGEPVVVAADRAEPTDLVTEVRALLGGLGRVSEA